MKNFFLLYLLFSVSFAYSQDTTIFYKTNIDKDIRFFNGPDTLTTLTRYDVSIVLKITDRSSIQSLRYEFYKKVTRDGITSDSVITRVNVDMSGVLSSSYNELNSTSYFMEGKKLYFIMRNLDIPSGRFIKVSSYNTGNSLTKNEIYNLDF